MHSPGINGQGELRGQPANPGSPGKWPLKYECVYCNTFAKCSDKLFRIRPGYCKVCCLVVRIYRWHFLSIVNRLWTYYKMTLVLVIAALAYSLWSLWVSWQAQVSGQYVNIKCWMYNFCSLQQFRISWPSWMRNVPRNPKLRKNGRRYHSHRHRFPT